MNIPYINRAYENSQYHQSGKSHHEEIKNNVRAVSKHFSSNHIVEKVNKIPAVETKEKKALEESDKKKELPGQTNILSKKEALANNISSGMNAPTQKRNSTQNVYKVKDALNKK